MLLQLNCNLCYSPFFPFPHHPSIKFSPSLKTHKFSAITATSSPIINPINSQLMQEEDEVEFEFEPVPDSFLEVTAEKDLKHLSSPPLEVKELEELPEQWRRSKIAWLCKELPSHKPATLIRILNAQRKWVRQDDASYVVLHCMRIRENESSYRVYKWMSQQSWYRFDFALVTKLADYLGKDRKFAKCRELFDDIIKQGRVPSESTFHILIVTYLSAPIDGCLEEACSIYNKMIQLGGYRPRLSLHNSLFRALVSKTGGASKQYLKQVEFIYHNLVTTKLEVHKDIYAGLIWLHSYQDVIDRERIASLREEMRNSGFDESKDVLLSIMRASSKEGDLEETEGTWLKLLVFGGALPSQAFVYRMELYARLDDPMKSLEIFKSMKDQTLATVVAYHKIIEIMAKSHKIDIAEKLMDEFIESGMKPLMPAFLDLIFMYFDLSMHDRLEVAFSKCITLCRPNRMLYNIYLESLVRSDNLQKAEEIFNELYDDGTIGATPRSCNTILGGFLSSDQYEKAEKIYDIMRRKKYVVEPQLIEKLEPIFSLKQKVVRRRASMKLDQEQREILIGLLLGGVRIESDEERRNHSIHFEFDENSEIHSSLRMHVHERFYEWLASSSRSVNEENEAPHRFSTIAHSYFGFFADQFWPKGRLMIPKLIHRWLSPRVLAYWYMHGGFRTSSGDILLKLKVGNREDVERAVKALQAKSLACKVKRKGKVFWIGLQGNNAASFFEMVDSYVLGSLRDHLIPYKDASGDQKGGRDFDIDSKSDSDES